MRTAASSLFLLTEGAIVPQPETNFFQVIVSEEYFVTSVCGIMGLIRYGVQCYTFIKGAHALGMKGSAFLFIPFELIIPLTTMYVSTVGQIGKRKLELWKV